MEDKIKVYIKVNENNEIIDVNSDIFIDDLTSWVYIDEGNGDKYSHAQSQYFEKPLQNLDGTYNYKYKNGKVVEV